MRIIAKIVGVIILVPLGIAGALLAAGSILSACGVPVYELLYTPRGWLFSTISYWGWMIGALIAFGSWAGLTWIFEGSKGLKELIDKIPDQEY